MWCDLFLNDEQFEVTGIERQCVLQKTYNEKLYGCYAVQMEVEVDIEQNQQLCTKEEPAGRDTVTLDTCCVTCHASDSIMVACLLKSHTMAALWLIY